MAMFGSPRDFPRAYVAAPVAAANGLFQAINWAFDQSEDLTWARIGVLVPQVSMVEELGLLWRLKARGVKIGTVGQDARARSFNGVLIVYGPDRKMLADAEDVPGVGGIAAVAVDNEELLPWVAAYAPQHLGGQLLPAPEAIIGEVGQQVVERLGDRLDLSTGLTRRGDIAVVVNSLHQLRHRGDHCTPEALMAAALRMHWPGRTAWALHQVAARVLTGAAASSTEGPPPLQPSA